MSPEELVGNATAVTAHFGRWPSFHDAEIVSVHLDRRGPSVEFVVHAWNVTGRLKPNGYYECRDFALVRFRCDNVAECSLDGFNHQNVIFDMRFTRPDDFVGVRVRVSTSHGLSATIAGERISVVDVVPATERGVPLPGGRAG